MDLSKYVILEQTETTLKLRHITTGDVSTRYKATCPNCSKDRGWKKNFKLDKLCNGCAQHLTFLSTVDRVKHSNVNFEDVKSYDKAGLKFLYRMTCLFCRKDRGYQPFYKAETSCPACVKQESSKLYSVVKLKVDKKVDKKESKVQVYKPTPAIRSTTKVKSIYLLAGCSGSGKSWVLSQLVDKGYDLLDSDNPSIKRDIRAAVDLTTRPVVSITVGISTFMNRNPDLDVKLLFLDESWETIEGRVVGRGGKVTDTLKRRFNRVKAFKSKACFSGTSSEVLDFLLEQS